MRAYTPLLEQEIPSILTLIGIDPNAPSDGEQPASSQPAATQQPTTSTTQGGRFGARYSRDQWWSIFRYSNRELISRQTVQVQTSNFTRFYNMFGPSSYIEQPQAYGRQMQQQFRVPWVVSGSANNWESIARNLDTVLRQAQSWESEQGEQVDRLSDDMIREIAQEISSALRGISWNEREVFYQLGRLGNQEDYDRLKEIYPSATRTNIDLEEQLNQFDNSEKQTLQRIFNQRNIRTGINFSSGTDDEFDVSSIVDGDPNETFESAAEIGRYFEDVFLGYIEQLNSIEDGKGDAFFEYINSPQSQNGQYFRDILAELRLGITKSDFDIRFRSLLRVLNSDFEAWYDENY